MSADASRPFASYQPPRSAADIPASTGALSTIDTSQLVRGYLEYIDTLKDRSDVSFDRMQSAVRSRLQQGEFGGSDVTSVYPEGDRITLSFRDGGAPTARSASLEFVSDRGTNEVSPHCRLPFDSLRDRLLRVDYAEGREWGELGDVGVWLFSKDDVWIEVITRWPKTNESDRVCVRTIHARGKFY
jgi:hypothetical protein